MVMLSAVCTWHAIVTRLVNHDEALADRVENIVLTILGVLYVLYNIGFVFIIYLFVSIFLSVLLALVLVLLVDVFVPVLLRVLLFLLSLSSRSCCVSLFCAYCSYSSKSSFQYFCAPAKIYRICLIFQI